jgi:cell division protein FtsW
VTATKRSSAAKRRGRAPSRARRDTRERKPGRTSRAAPLDGAIVVSTAVLVGFGIVMNYSATAALAIGEPLPPLAARHAVGVALALVCAAFASRLPLALWRRLALPLWVVTTGLLAATLVVGVEANGARRWIAVPGLPFSVQPAEFARFATVLAVAAVLARAMGRRDTGVGSLRAVLLLTGAPVLLLALQPDFSGAVLLVVIIGLVLFAAGLPLRMLALPGAASALAAALYVASNPYALARVRGFLDPWQNARGGGFQLVQSFVAFGRGGSFGVGVGDGRQKLFYLPEAHTDFILSVVAEELGLVGVLVILGSFAAFAIAGLRIARRSREPFALLTAFGMTMLIAVPAIVNAAVVMGVLPTTGLTLPFLSHGSNSLCCAALAVGILLRVAAREAPPQRARVAGATPRGLVRT